MSTIKTATILSLLVAALTSGCVDHRPIRNGVPDENVYLAKDFFTRENPHQQGAGDRSWLYKVTVLKSSVPELGFLTVGDNSQPRYVEFQLSKSTLEMIDATEYAPLVEDPDGQLGLSPSLSRTVLNAWPGSHVDIRMRDNLDGERTNFLEENQEKPWAERQWFKVDFEKAAVADVNMLYWATSDYTIGDCMELVSASLVPGSFEVEEEAAEGGDDYLSWTMALTYRLKVYGGGYYCGDVITDAMDRSTFTYHVKYSFWRVPKSSYQPVELTEKDPMRQRAGAFETAFGRLSVYHDPQTDLPGAKSFMMRFDPQKSHTFYFTPSFPERYKDHFRVDVAQQFNGLMEEEGVPLRIDFQDWNAGGKERSFGDLRYSMLTYHSAPSTSGLIGMAYLNADPRTGELLSGGFNMYDWVDQLYTYLIQDYLTQVTGDTFDDRDSPLPATCTPGEKVALDEEKIAEKHQSTSLYSKLEDYMGQPASEWVETRAQSFGDHLRRLLPDLRFAVPFWNQYVYREQEQSWRAELPARQELERRFQRATAALDRGENPFGASNVLAPGAIERGLDHLNAMKEQVRNHTQLQAREALLRGLRLKDSFADWQLGPAMARSARTCKADGTWETREEWAQRVVDTFFKVLATHEFGHTLSLRHNFYGSMDKPHFEGDSITSSIMEYSVTMAESAEAPRFQPYDRMALKWIYAGKQPDPAENWLYCTDEHAYFSPFCTTFDMGTTPTEIVKNAIDDYEWSYKFRNFRAYRKFWSTSSYVSRVIGSLYPLRRLLNAWAIDFEASELKNDLILLGATGDEHFFANIQYEFAEELGQANRLAANFYKAILQQSAAERSYATKFDNFYGDITQQGIILDKYFAMLLFLGLWPVDDYDQNIYSYLAYHESSRGNNRFYSDVQDITDSMIGGQYDVYPWFVPTAVLLFAQDTHDVMFGDSSKQQWIAMKRFDRATDMVEVFGFDPRGEALALNNPYQTFRDGDGSSWIYYYMVDRNVHLVASKDLNPTAFKLLWDQNEAINVNKVSYLSDYQIKYHLDFYEYFN